jgi:hypothetical protein
MMAVEVMPEAMMPVEDGHGMTDDMPLRMAGAVDAGRRRPAGMHLHVEDGTTRRKEPHGQRDGSREQLAGSQAEHGVRSPHHQ